MRNLYGWDHGLAVAASKTRTLVRCCPEDRDYWTWVDSLGERCWELAV